MPDLEIKIGGRSFTVSCQEGEEHFLNGAAAMLDVEAQPLVAQMGRLPEARMLLMAGLMLADKTAAVEDENRQLKLKLSNLESRPAPEREKLEVPVIPPGLTETLAEIAARAEAVAASLEERTLQ
ncbi:MAG: cell division protein ZapA [Cypionkella sp.]